MKTILSLLLFSLLTSCGHMTKKSSQKKVYSPTISFSEDSKTFQANIELPKKFSDPLPLIVIVHEWWGRTEHITNVSQQLKKEGYATLAVDLFGDGRSVETPNEAQELSGPFYQNPQIGIERLNKYIELAKNDPHIDPKKIFVVGYCFGGVQALNYARSGADVKGVVSFHANLKTTVTSPGVKAEVLVLNGLADLMVSAQERAGLESEMKALKAKYKVVNYKGASHAFTNPKSTEVGRKYNIPIAYNKKAAEASWKELLRFLKR